MILDKELAQEIMDYTKKIVSYTVNIVNTDGIIIASTNPARINTYHFAGKLAIESNAPYVLDEEEASFHPDCVPGINLPIHFRGEIIGALGVGAREESELIGKMLLSTTELLIEQSFLQKEVHEEQQIHSDFFSHLLTESWHANQFYFDRQIKLVGLDKTQGYFISDIVVRDSIFNPGGENAVNSNITHYNRIRNNFSARIKNDLSMYNPVVVFLPSQIVVLIPCEIQGFPDRHKFVLKYINRISVVMRSLVGEEWKLGIGGFADDMTQIHKIYTHVFYGLRISSVIAPGQQVIHFRNFYTEYELLTLPEGNRKRFSEHILGKLLLPENELWLTTLEAFFDNGKSIVDTSDALFIHRNTLLFRLHKIEHLTGFNPLDFKASATLYQAMLLYKLRNFDDTMDVSL